MDCEHCQPRISQFLDNELDAPDSSDVQAHLAVCAGCAKMCEDLAMILDFCREESEPETIVPPNSQALWCRIHNEIEADIKQQFHAQIQQADQSPKKWYAAVWRLSFSQVASAVLGIALISSLLTFVGIKNYAAKSAGDYSASVSAAPNFFDKLLAKAGLIDTPQQNRERRIAQQQTAIDYWNKRVEARRMQWDNHLRVAFDRNLSEIDQAVNEYTMILQNNPQDDLSGEMLDSAMNEKMELLREFSDL